MAYIRKRQGKRGIRWQAVVRLKGTRPQVQTFPTKSQAVVWANSVENDIHSGAALPSQESKRRTVRELLDRYIASEIPKKKDQANPRRIAKYWICRIGDVRLIQLTRARVVEERDRLAINRAPATVNRYLAVLSHACSIAKREWEWMTSNPLRKVSRMKESAGRIRFLDDDERRRLLDAVGSSEHPHLYAIVLIALTTGARRGEILGLNWKDIDFDRRRAVVSATKNDAPKTLVLVPPVIDELRRLRKVRLIGSDVIFVNPVTGQSQYFYFEKAWREAREKAQIDDFRFHDLRHCCASYLAMNGATAAEIAAVLGHKTLAMVKRYAHLSEDHIHAVVERTALRTINDESCN